MPIDTKCSFCGKAYRLDDAVAGKKVRCKGCGNAFVANAAGARSGGNENDLYAGLASAAHAETQHKPRPSGMNLDDDGPGENYDLAQPEMAVDTSSEICASCGVYIAAGARVCMTCGFDRVAGRHVTIASARNVQRADNEERDRQGNRIVPEFTHPAARMMESIALNAAAIVTACCFFFLLLGFPTWLSYRYHSDTNERIKNMEKLGASQEDINKMQERLPSAGKLWFSGLFIGLGLIVGGAIVYGVSLVGHKMAGMIMKYQPPDGQSQRLTAMFIAGWLIFVIYVLVAFSNYRGAGIHIVQDQMVIIDRLGDGKGGVSGFMPYVSLLAMSFFWWVDWLGVELALKIGFGSNAPYSSMTGVGYILVIVFGSLVMFPTYWFVNRLKIIDALVGWGMTFVGAIIGAAIAGPAMYGVFQLVPSIFEERQWMIVKSYLFAGLYH